MLTFVICLALFSVISISHIFGDILGGIGGLYGAHKDRQEQREVRKYNELMAKKGRGFLTKGMLEQAGYDEQMMQYLTDSAAMSRSIGARGQQDVQAMYAQGIGDVQQQMASRGLGGTTLSGNLMGGMMGQYSRGMADFSSGVMGQQAQAQGILGQGVMAIGEHRMEGNIDIAQSYFGQKAKAVGGQTKAWAELGSGIGSGLDMAFLA